MKKIIVSTVLILAVVGALVICNLCLPSEKNKLGDDTITTSQLKKVVNINELSTAQYVHNGVADYKTEDSFGREQEYHIAYEAKVNVVVDMSQIDFQIDQEQMTVTPKLPELTLGSVELDEGSLGYIPKNPDMELKEILACCEDDVQTEAQEAEELFELAEENLQSIVEALVKPFLDDAGYRLVWSVEQ